MKLMDICEAIVDCEHKTALTQEEGYPSIRTPNIGRGYFILDGVNRVSEETYRLWTRRAVPQPGDLIMAREAPVGNVAMIPEGLEPCLGQRTLLIRPNRRLVDPRYLTYLLVGPQVQGVIHGMTNGATVPHLNMKDVRNLSLPVLPSLPTQKKLAAVLSAYDDLIANNTRRIAVLEEMAQSLYREWFVRFRFPGHEQVRFIETEQGRVPEGWVRYLGDIITLKRGYDLPERDRVPGEVPIVSSSGITGWHNQAMVAGPGVVTGRYGTLGEAFLIQQKFWPLNTTLYVQDFKGNDPILICRLLRSLNLGRHNTAGAVPGLNRNALHMLEVVFPTTDHQQRIKPFLGDNERMQALLHKKNENLRRTRDLLLPKLISGELDVEHLDIDTGEPLAVTEGQL